MKMKPTLILTFFLFSSLSFAGNEGSGGGDQCRNIINQTRLNIKDWIEKDDAKDLILEEGWSYDSPVSSKNYKSSMLSVLADRKVIVTCYLNPSRFNDPAAQKISKNEAVEFKSILIGEEGNLKNPATPTTCINYQDSIGQLRIDCDYDRIVDSNSIGDLNFRNIHHEFASLVGIEKKDGTSFSDFFVSNQLAEFGGWKQVRFLGPRKAILGDDDTDWPGKVAKMIHISLSRDTKNGSVPIIMLRKQTDASDDDGTVVRQPPVIAQSSLPWDLGYVVFGLQSKRADGTINQDAHCMLFLWNSPNGCGKMIRKPDGDGVVVNNLKAGQLLAVIPLSSFYFQISLNEAIAIKNGEMHAPSILVKIGQKTFDLAEYNQDWLMRGVEHIIKNANPQRPNELYSWQYNLLIRIDP